MLKVFSAILIGLLMISDINSMPLSLKEETVILFRFKRAGRGVVGNCEYALTPYNTCADQPILKKATYLDGRIRQNAYALPYKRVRHPDLKCKKKKNLLKLRKKNLLII